MLIEFRVANFRSIREEQVLSLVASRADKELETSLIDVTLPGMAKTRYLRGAAIYGHNASGKTNILLAFEYVVGLVMNSAVGLKPGDGTGTEPFKLDAVSIDKPSRFEMTFVMDTVRYLYGVSLTAERVIEEYLVAYPKGLPQKWFRRVYDHEKRQYNWDPPSSFFKADASLQERTRDNSLFLSVGPQFNDAQLTTVYRWFKGHVRFMKLSSDYSLQPSYTAQRLLRGDDSKNILNLLRSADIAIVDASIEEKDINLDSLRETLSAKAFSELVSESSGKKSFEVSLLHATGEGSPVGLNYAQEESAGTRRLFALAGPWMDILEHGYLVLIDEFETSLHPLLVKELIRLMQDPKTNPKGAQIIFTTHSPTLLDTDLFRRDQIWFTEKDETGATRLYPLSDYQPRKGEAIAKGYLAGRYGAIPFIPAGLQV
jgi:uncharacterized protein